MPTGNTIDKFGRKRKHKESIPIRDTFRVPFNLTSDGNYNFENKRVCNLGEPLIGTDGVTKDYVDVHLVQCVQDTRTAVQESSNIIVQNLEENLQKTTAELFQQLKDFVKVEITKSHDSIMGKLKRSVVDVKHPSPKSKHGH
jgi:predicted restriction endonuclease